MLDRIKSERVSEVTNTLIAATCGIFFGLMMAAFVGG